MPVGFQVSASNYSAAVTSLSTGNITPAGVELYCILMLAVDYSHGGITACTFRGVSATALATGTRVAIYGIIPTAGVAGACSFSWVTNRAASVSVISFTGVDQVNPTGSVGTGSGGSGTSSVSLAALASQAVADVVGVNGSATAILGAGHSAVWGPGYTGGHGYTLGVSSTHQWSINNNWDAKAVLINDSPTSGAETKFYSFPVLGRLSRGRLGLRRHQPWGY